MSLRRPAKNQPENFEFNPSSLEAAKSIVAKYPEGKQQSAVMALLYIAQKQNDNWIPLAAMKYIAKFLDMPYIKVYEVATFYSMYNLSPVGKYFVQVCTTTPCMIRGANKLVEACKEKISKNLSAGTLSFEFSSMGEKIITNCGASEGHGKNPEYLRYSAAHSTIILQNTNISEIKEENPHIKFPQSVTFQSDSYLGYKIYEGSHNGYQRRFNRIIKRKLKISDKDNKIYGEDSIISIKSNESKIIYHIRFHLTDGFVFSFTNNKKNIILRSSSKNMWIFKSDVELEVEDSIIVDKNTTIPTKQIVIKGITNKKKDTRTWSLEKI